MQQLTVKEALEQGYTKYCFNQDGFQGLRDINEDIDPLDFENGRIRIVDKNSYSPLGVTSKEIAEILAEQIECNHVDDSGDDTEQVYEAIKALDFSDVEKRIAEALSKLQYYRATDIKLIPN